MPHWLRIVLAIAAGFVVWWVVATVGNWAIRALLPGYAEVEKAMTFSLAMLVARLVLGAVSSLAAGATATTIARRARVASLVLAFLLLALFIPVHASLWPRFPAWYHIVFLVSLPLLVLAGARLATSARKP
ncbi:MAG: hypothetical protein ACM3X5_05425 [Bacillota bacterium]